LFVAIGLTDGVRAALKRSQASLGPACKDVRWIPSEQLHLTLKFLGEVPDGEVDGVAEGVAAGAALGRPFAMEVGGCGCFPPRGAVRIVWAGVHEPSGALAECVERVEQELENIGYPREDRPFSAHITMGRVREDRSRGALRDAVEGFTLDRVGQPVREITLMASVLSPRGPSYTVVSRMRLGPVE